MEQTIIPPFNNADLQNQALSFANCLSAAYSIPLIECIYYNGSSIDQLQSIRIVFDKIIPRFILFGGQPFFWLNYPIYATANATGEL